MVDNGISVQLDASAAKETAEFTDQEMEQVLVLADAIMGILVALSNEDRAGNVISHVIAQYIMMHKPIDTLTPQQVSDKRQKLLEAIADHTSGLLSMYEKAAASQENAKG